MTHPSGGLERAQLRAKVLAEGIEIPETAQHRAEPIQLAPQGADPPGIEHVPGRAQDGPEPADRRAHRVEFLGVSPEPRAGFLGTNRLDLLSHQRQDVVTGRAAGPNSRTLRGAGAWHAKKYLKNVRLYPRVARRLRGDPQCREPQRSRAEA